MASRRLALNLRQGLKVPRAGLSLPPLRRGLATPVASPALKTQSTTLKNGLTVRLDNDGGQLAQARNID